MVGTAPIPRQKCGQSWQNKFPRSSQSWNMDNYDNLISPLPMLDASVIEVVAVQPPNKNRKMHIGITQMQRITNFTLISACRRFRSTSSSNHSALANTKGPRNSKTKMPGTDWASGHTSTSCHCLSLDTSPSDTA